MTKDDKKEEIAEIKYRQIFGWILLLISFIIACFTEKVFSNQFDIFTLPGLLLSMALGRSFPLFWIGLGLEEWGRMKKGKRNKNI